jgi:DNA-binding response OmpR family regulator
MRLLVVEDEDRMTEILKRALARAGFVVDAVALCADAQAAFAVTHYDAAILDLGLPDGDGIRLLREPRSSGNQTPVRPDRP